MDYLKKYDENPFEDLYWNIPEQKQGIVNIVGGNSQVFRTSVKTAEFLSGKYPVREVRIVFPDALQGMLPNLNNLVFLKSTDSGSFGDSDQLVAAFNAGDYNVLVGDLSRNSITEKAVRSASETSDKPLLITRDAVDLVAVSGAEKMLMNENIILMASVAQLQKLFRAVYYPKVLLMSQSLVQVVEALHKFTLSYPVSIVTLHDGQIVVVKNGEVAVVPLEQSGYAPFTVWSGELAAKIAALNVYNPNNYVAATVAAIYSR